MWCCLLSYVFAQCGLDFAGSITLSSGHNFRALLPTVSCLFPIGAVVINKLPSANCFPKNDTKNYRVTRQCLCQRDVVVKHGYQTQCHGHNADPNTMSGITCLLIAIVPNHAAESVCHHEPPVCWTSSQRGIARAFVWQWRHGGSWKPRKPYSSRVGTVAAGDQQDVLYVITILVFWWAGCLRFNSLLAVFMFVPMVVMVVGFVASHDFHETILLLIVLRREEWR